MREKLSDVKCHQLIEKHLYNLGHIRDDVITDEMLHDVTHEIISIQANLFAVLVSNLSSFTKEHQIIIKEIEELGDVLSYIKKEIK